MRVIILMLLIIVAHCSIAAPLQLEIFTVSARPVVVNTPTTVTVDYYNLDTAQQLLTVLKHKQDLAQAQSHFNASQDALQQAFKGLALMTHYDIHFIPAIVINGEAIIEGQTNAAVAIEEYEAWHKK